MDAAQKVIFEPPPPKVDPAHADSGGGLWGVALALKYRRDETHLDLYYHEKREMAYLQSNTVSSSLGGFIDEIKADPEAEKRYFKTLYLSEWERKISRTVKAIVNWPDPSRKWIGEPVAFLSVQLGYPDVNGQLQWAGHMFQATDAPDAIWQSAVEMKKLSDVTNPPSGWKPDITFVKRKIHFAEPPDESTYPYARIFIERNEVDLDLGANGTPTNELNLEVRADSAGKFDIGPMALNVDLDSPKQIVEISFQCLGSTLDGLPRNITKFQWLYSDQTEPRYWAIYTGQLDFKSEFRYQVKVVIKGSLTTKGMEWTGPWVTTTGNGPTIITVPTPDDPDVTVKRDFPISPGIEPHAPPATGTGVSTPPATGGGSTGSPTGHPVGPPPATPASKKDGKTGDLQAHGYKVGPEVSVSKKLPTRGDVDTQPHSIFGGWTSIDPTTKKASK